MNHVTYAKPVLLLVLLTGFLNRSQAIAREPDRVAEIQYSRDVRPILSTKCWHCHGPDANARRAGLRLDRPHDDESNPVRGVITPGDPQKSLLIKKITHKDPASRMPPATEPRQLNEHEIDVLVRWIRSGAEFDSHWAFGSIQTPIPPTARRDPWVRNPIDRFVLNRLGDVGLAPAGEADRGTLIRRVSMDLVGVPPSFDELGEFLRDDSSQAYERLVDRLLQSPQFGERMAVPWLDAARFADSGGYQGDILRSMWLWRDWVIRALNTNMPFDQFTIEQLAGDLLPNPTIDQRIATGFHRNHRINDEDGIILEEFRVEYVADRAETTAAVWLGLTVQCARCHDHKYDPMTQKEYYELFAFFNSIDEKGRGHGNAPPLLQASSPLQRIELAELKRNLNDLKEQRQKDADVEKEITAITARIAKVEKSRPSVMVLQELPVPRPTHMLIRGAYDQPGEEVSPGTPRFLPRDNDTTNRLGLARWLVSPSNPLTARVIVNRFWQSLFGRGIVATSGDFGTQGELPTHPELLDWLAQEFIRSGWDIKHILRVIVSSATYRQSSDGSTEKQRLDPPNKFLSRGPRFRLDAELIRDQALAVSGLLVRRIGGASVRPYQPKGLWRDLVSASLDYNQGTGPDLYRRSIYTFVRRTVPPPAMIVFDAPNRELCQVNRARTNTPLQSLVLMNDPTYVEAARHVAIRVLEKTSSVRDSVDRAFQLILSRLPSTREQRVLIDSYKYYSSRFNADSVAVTSLLQIGSRPIPLDVNQADLATCMAVCHTIMNLDEFVTKE